MQTSCHVDHSLEGTIPRGLCRSCRPELNAKPNAEGARQHAGETAHKQQLQCSAIAA